MRVFSKAVPDPNDAKELLAAACDRRLSLRGTSKDTHLQVHDIQVALRDSHNRLSKKLVTEEQQQQQQKWDHDYNQVYDCDNDHNDDKDDNEDYDDDNHQNYDDGNHDCQSQNQSHQAMSNRNNLMMKRKNRSCVYQNQTMVCTVVKELKRMDLASKVLRLEAFNKAAWEKVCYRQ